jgi:aminomuconate-semialdehyde/2-hydroxymuconate-6-semialdehyde dehydrogenase
LQGGYFLNPTIIVGLPATECRVQKEEIFGPVVTVTPFKTEAEVIEYANAVEYGLSASVWTENAKVANRVALNLDCGTVWVNCWLLVSFHFPSFPSFILSF